MFWFTVTYTYPAGNPPSPGDTAMYFSTDAPAGGRVANVLTAGGVVGLMALTVSVLVWVTSTASAVTATPSAFLIPAKRDGPVGVLSRPLSNRMMLLWVGPQLGWLSFPVVVRREMVPKSRIV